MMGKQKEICNFCLNGMCPYDILDEEVKIFLTDKGVTPQQYCETANERNQDFIDNLPFTDPLAVFDIGDKHDRHSQ